MDHLIFEYKKPLLCAKHRRVCYVIVTETFLGRKKKAAPPPPAMNKPKLAPPQEEPECDEPPETQRKSQTLPVIAKTFKTDAQEKSKTVSRIELNNNDVVEPPNLSPATSSSLSSLSRSDVDRGTLPKTPTVLKYSKIPLSFLSGSRQPAGKYQPSVALNNLNHVADNDDVVFDSQYKTTESWDTFLEHLNDVLACKNEEYV